MNTRRTLHTLLVAAVAAAALGTAAQAAPPKKKKLVPTESKFYFRANGCGPTQEAGRLEPKSGADSSTGCGIIGGLPVDEVIHQVEGSTPMDFKTGKKGVPVILDSSRKITGVVATQSWIDPAVGGVGKVEVDLALSGVTTSGKLISFGATTVTADAAPTTGVTTIPFEVAVPAAAGKLAFKSLTVAVSTRGANFNMNAQHYDGDAWVVYPSFTLK